MIRSWNPRRWGGTVILVASLLWATGIRGGEFASAVPGDCDGDGTVSIGEVQRAINMFLGIEPAGCGADCDGDGTLSIGEVQRVINGFLGYETSCPVTCVLTCSALASTTSGTAPLAVSFAATATATGCSGSSSFLWSFGDGTTSGLQNPDHTYAQPGPYAWSATVTQDGQSCTEEGTVVVYPDAVGITVNLPGGVTMFLVKIPGGTFQMGRYPGERGSNNSEDPRHGVTIGYDFYMGRTEVTQGQWEAVMGTTPAIDCAPAYDNGDDYPVYCVSWEDIAGPANAESFLKKLDAHLVATGQPGAGKFRLPSEAEWEYAARAGTATRFSHGDVLECGDACEACDLHIPYMWWCGGTPPGGSKQVGTKAPNPFGLYDMHGNVCEWVQDWYHGNYVGAPSDGSAWVGTGPYRVFRGGTWFSDAQYCRSAIRRNSVSGDRGFTIGFRLVRSL